jgi:hypothetical protein
MSLVQRVGLTTALIVGAVTVSLATASALPPIHPTVIPAKDRPVAGHTFTGLKIEKHGQSISRVLCDAAIGGKRLRAHQIWGTKTITCSWRIPAGVSGRKLLPWRYRFGRLCRVSWGAGYVQGQFAWRVTAPR